MGDYPALLACRLIQPSHCVCNMIAIQKREKHACLFVALLLRRCLDMLFLICSVVCIKSLFLSCYPLYQSLIINCRVNDSLHTHTSLFSPSSLLVRPQQLAFAACPCRLKHSFKPFGKSWYTAQSSLHESCADDIQRRIGAGINRGSYPDKQIAGERV